MCPLVPEAVSYFAGEKFANSSFGEVANFLSPTSWVAGMSSAKKKGDNIGTGFIKGLGYDAAKVALVFGGIGAAGGLGAGAGAAGAGGAGTTGSVAAQEAAFTANTGMASAGLGGTATTTPLSAAPATVQSSLGATTTAAKTSASVSPLVKTAIGLQLAGGAASAFGSYQQGQEEAKELERQAKLEETRANLAYESAAQEKRDLQRRQRQVIGKARTMAAANGVLLDNNAASSPNVYTQDALSEVQYESDKIDYNTELEAYTRRENARVMRRNARTARRSGMLKSVTSLITSGAGAIGTYFSARR